MARAGLRLGVRELAQQAKVSTNTITRLERGETMHERTLDAVQGALERAGMDFIPEGEASDDGGPGLRFRRKPGRPRKKPAKEARNHA